MKKWVKTMLVVVLTLAMLVSTAAATAQVSPTRDENSKFTNPPASGTANTAAADTSSFNLIKDYILVNSGGRSPKEDFSYTITPYGVWNADGTYTSGVFTDSAPHILPPDFPMLQGTESPSTHATNSLTLTYSAAANAANSSTTNTLTTTVYLPNYTVVGDYWYKVVETVGNTAGVDYGTNAASNATYYIHVQVTAGSPNVRNVTMHKTAPSGDDSAAYNATSTGYAATYYNEESDKVNNIQNTYSAGSLAITKTVTGNAGDKSEYFQVTVVFTEPSGQNVNSDIFFTAYASDGAGSMTNYYIKGDSATESTTYSGKTQYATTWSSTAGPKTVTATFWIKDNNTVTFTNIPYGVTYTVTETLLPDYQNSLAFTTTKSGTDNDDSSKTLNNTVNKTAFGDIDDASDAITITNNKTVAIDIGVITEDAPYVALLTVAAAAGVLLVLRKKRTTEV